MRDKWQGNRQKAIDIAAQILELSVDSLTLSFEHALKERKGKEPRVEDPTDAGKHHDCSLFFYPLIKMLFLKILSGQ